LYKVDSDTVAPLEFEYLNLLKIKMATTKLRSITLFFVALLISLVSAAQERRVKTDVYVGYSRVGANLFSPYTPGMNGIQLTMHVKPIPFVGIEGDVSRYSAGVGTGSQQATLAMFGPRVTAGVMHFSVFAHALGGLAHTRIDAVNTLPGFSSTATSYAIGGGADVPLFLSFKLRATGDYLGYGDAPSSTYSPSHYRFGVGIAYHF
jgi:opacity protein-like surface antigen